MSTAETQREIPHGKSGKNAVPSGAMDSFGHSRVSKSAHDLVLRRSSDARCHPIRKRAPKSSVCFERHILIKKLADW
jgi:hypothetical protein